MTEHTPVVLVIDDDPVNLEIISNFLEQDQLELVTALNGEQALALLEQRNDIDLVLLDRMMPDLDGLEILRLIKQDPRLKMIPVIMQTALSDPDEVAAGIRAGCFYYLTKPFSSGLIRQVVTTALRDRRQRSGLQDSLASYRHGIALMNAATFDFRTRDEAIHLAAMLSNLSASPASLNIGLSELMLNAVEHGNLGISYAETTELLQQQRFVQEVERRLALPEYARAFASISFRRVGRQFEFTIQDAGQGFDWTPYLELRPERLMDNHGRGIAMVNKMVFSSLEYRGSGNTVTAVYSESS